MVDPQITQKTRRRRRLRWALIASLAVNLVFLGLFAGAAYRFAGGPGASHHGGRGPDARNYATAYVRALPEDRRRALFEQMRSGTQEMPSRAARRALYQQVLSALRAEPFDPAAVQNVLRAQGAMAFRFQTASEGAWLAQVESMSAAERAAYADEVEELLNRRPGKRGKPPRD